ncbi:hypothetical protein PsJ27TS7_05770 [Paenibacillus dendritiformis]
MVHTYINKPQNIQYFCFLVMGVARWSGGLICGGCGGEPGKDAYGEVMGMGGEIEKSASWWETLRVRACAFETG